MSVKPLDLSDSLKRAARHERQRVRTERTRIESRLEGLEQERLQLESERARLLQRERLLDQIVEDQHPTPGEDPAPAGLVLRGADLREEAARVLLRRVGRDRPIHYRELYDLFRDEGFVVLGKRPLASFLTALSRSPIVRHGEEPGSYALHPPARSAIDAEHREVLAELHDLDGILQRESNPAPALRQHRVNLLASARRLQRQLDEIDRVLAAETSERTSEAA